MLKYGSDKPDLRNPLVVTDVSEIFRDSSFGIFAKSVAAGGIVRAIPAPGTAERPRSFFDKLNEWAREQGAAGLGYIIFAEGGGKGPIAKNLDAGRIASCAGRRTLATAIPCSSSATRSPWPRNSPAPCAASWATSSA
jgi:Aspartyl-tRNA synthetase